jgi:hypothetical protein
LRSNAVTIAPSVVIAPDPRFSATLGLTGTQFTTNVRALGGTAGLGARIPLGQYFAATASASGSATRTSFDATYASAEATPTLEATVSALTLFGGARLANGSNTLPQPVGGGLAGTVTGTRNVTTSRNSAGAVYGGVVRLPSTRADYRSALTYREERASVSGVRVTDRAATAAFGSDQLSLSGTLGMRDAVDERLTYGSVSSSVAVTRGLALQGAVGSYPSNRLTGTMAGRFASVGVVLHGARRIDRPTDDTPLIRGAPAVPPGVTRLAIEARGARRVDVAGDWNGWSTLPATRGADGTWYVDVRLPPGEYRYAFKIDGRRWDVPRNVTAIDDGFGGRSALLTVR